MSDRGAYRGIHTVLIDGPDYQALTPAARLVFLTLKLNLGPAGIDVLYPAVLEDQTGHAAPAIAAALVELERADWIRRDRNVVWIVEGLRHEPSRSLKNANHTQEIDGHLNALPRLAIVETFRRHYGIGAPAEPTTPEGMGNGIPHPIPKHRVTEERKTEDGQTENGEDPARGARGAPSLALVRPEPEPPPGAPALTVTTAVVLAPPNRVRPRTHTDVVQSVERWVGECRADAGAKRRTEDDRRQQALVVFAYWQSVWDKRRSLYDEGRERVLVKRLTENGSDVSELFYAVDGAKRDPYARDARQGDLAFILGSRARVEEYAGKCKGYGNEQPHPRAASLARALAGEPSEPDDVIDVTPAVEVQHVPA